MGRVTGVLAILNGMVALLIVLGVSCIFTFEVALMRLKELFVFAKLGVCPNGVAWADKPYATDSAHRIVECSNAGVCDRMSGTCQCYDGFTGNACQRSKFFLSEIFLSLCMFMLIQIWIALFALAVYLFYLHFKNI